MLFTKGRWLEGSLFVGLLLAVAALVYFLGSSWRPFPGVFVLFITVAAIVVAMKSDPPLSKREKLAWLLLTGVLAFLEICAMTRADADAQKAREDEHNAFGLLLSNANDLISNMTGGDSFPYVDVEITGGGRLIVSKLKVEGKYSLRQVQLRVQNTDGLKKLNQYRSAVSPNELAQATVKVTRNFSEVSPANPWILDDEAGVDGTPGAEKRYDCKISANNGLWSEKLRLQKVGDGWKRAIRVLQIVPGKPESEWQERKKEVASDFPGEPDWND